MAAIQGFGRSEIRGNSMLDDAILLQDRVEDFERTASVDEEVLGDNVKPIDDGFFLQNMPVVGTTEPDSDCPLNELAGMER